MRSGLRSFVPLFEKVMAVRCTQYLSHLSEAGAGALNTSCYMWWLDLNFADHSGDGEGQGNLIEEFLRSNPGVRPELAAYTPSARRGCIL